MSPIIDTIKGSCIIVRVTFKIKDHKFHWIKPHRIQYILIHFYHTTIAKLLKFEALARPENHKDSPCP